MIKSLFIILLAFGSNIKLISQGDPEELFFDAEYCIEIEDYESALDNYIKILKKDNENCNLNYRAGQCCLKLPERNEEALSYLEKAIKQITPKYKEGSFEENSAPPEAMLLFGTSLLQHNRIEEARQAFKQYKEYLKPNEVAKLDEADQQLKYCDNAESFSKSEIRFQATDLTEYFKGQKPKFRLVSNSDVTSVVFLAEKAGILSVYYSTFENGQWSLPDDITTDLAINARTDKYTICSMSGDGKRIYLIISDDFDSRIYVATLKGTRWGGAKPLNRKVNTSNDETHACESPDGTELYFTSNRKGTVGNLDIFVSKMKSNGDWDSPINLGSTINTYFNEETPFITKDNQKLYFSSQGHISMGGYDIFVSNRLPDGSWSEPQNIGYPINSTGDDVFFFPFGENKGYYQMGHSSPYTVAQIEILPPVVEAITQIDTTIVPKPDTTTVAITTPVVDTVPVIIAQAADTITTPTQVTDTITSTIPQVETSTVVQPVAKSTLKGSIIFSDDSKSFEIIIVTLTDPNNNTSKVYISEEGTFTESLEPGNYTITFEANEYQKETKHFTTIAEQPTTLNVVMRPVVIKDQYVSIRSILFNYNSVILDKESKTMLERLIRIMRDYPSLTLEIIGHADSKGNPEYNRKISLDRARAVADYFVNQGIDETRFTLFGFGDALAIAIDVNPDGSDNPAGRRFNRRVELRLTNYSNLKIVNAELEIPENLRVKETFEYYICLKESPKEVSKDEYASKTDTSLIKINNIGKEYVVTLNPPMSKAEAIKKLEEINNTFPEAYIIPDNYFTKVKKVSAVGSYRYASSSNFTIQLLATKRKMKTTAFKPYTDVKEYKGMDGLLRYTYGLFSSWDNAYPTLLKVRKQGYNDAFIAPMAKFTGNLLDKRLNGYTIQLWTGFTPKDTSMYRNVGGIKVNKTSDNVYRYSTGTFETFPEAKARLKQLQKLGYSNALIKKQSDMEK